MMKKGMIAISAAITAAVLSGCASRSSEDPDSPAAVNPDSEAAVQVIESYERLQRFGYDLFAQNIQDQNPVLSPVSAYLALSIAGSGADSATREEFDSVLGADMAVYSGDMMNSLPRSGERLELSIANSVWIDDEFHVDDVWMGMVRSLMDAEAFQADLSTEAAADSMNRWIAAKTNGMIDQMLEDPLDRWTRLVIFDTVYFKGRWEKPFEAQNTHREDFCVDKAQGITEQVDMMNQYWSSLDYISNDFAEGVILPYQNNPEEGFEQHQSIPYRDAKMALIVLKPRSGGDIRDVYGRMTMEAMESMLSNRQNEIINLKLPRFEVTFDKELNKCLHDMGLRTCFDPVRADFTRMGTTQSDANLYISLVRQKAKIIVDEEGTEAAAVTEIDMRDGCGTLSEPKDLFFNEPFLYMVMDMEQKLPVFIGILDDPKGE